MKIKILMDSTLDVNFYGFDFKEICENGWKVSDQSQTREKVIRLWLEDLYS